MTLKRVVILGAGTAATQAVDTLRRSGFTGSITLVGEEPELPYHRPPLSKAYLAGSLDRTRLKLRPERFFSDLQVTTLLGYRATQIDRAARCVRVEDASEVAYDALLCATGSHLRKLLVPGAELEGVHYLHTINDAGLLREELLNARRLVIVGGGYIGLEVAATCRTLGIEVTVLETAERLMRRAVGSDVSTFFQVEHERRGVNIRCNTQVCALLERAGTRRVQRVQCADGTEHPADLVLVCIGVRAADELAATAGLECDDGIIVDATCRTSDAAIFAAGDCARQRIDRSGKTVRIESVDNAIEQARCASLNIAGTPTTHDKVPWFWSDQYDHKLLIAGLSHTHDRVLLRGDPGSRSFSACYLRGRELIALEAVNAPQDHMAARRLLAARAEVDLSKLANSEIPLKQCVLSAEQRCTSADMRADIGYAGISECSN
jgi:3-phenylpropionate/trans-cinnamate dioxygenase ferredoxin reductase component